MKRRRVPKTKESDQEVPPPLMEPEVTISPRGAYRQLQRFTSTLSPRGRNQVIVAWVLAVAAVMTVLIVGALATR